MATCRSCDAEIRWVRGVSGALMPLDATPRSDGNIVVRNGRAYVLKTGERPEEGEERFVNHFATCPHAAAHRKRPALPPPAGAWGPPAGDGPKQGRLFRGEGP